MSVYQFIPSVTSPFQFQPTLDGGQYVASVRWNIASQRWYLFVDDVSGVNIVTAGMNGSPTGFAIGAADFNEEALTAEIATQFPHGYAIGATILLTVREMLPDAWNGAVEGFITGDNTISYALSANPGAATQLGFVSYDVNLVAGYFDVSAIIWRPGAAQIEVTP